MQPEMFTFWIRYFFIFSYFPKYWITAYIKRCCCYCQRNWQENPSTKGTVSGQRHKHTTKPPSHHREVAFTTATSLSTVEEIRGEHEDPLWWSWIWCLRLRLCRAIGCTTLTQGHLPPRIWWVAETSRGYVQWKGFENYKGVGPWREFRASIRGGFRGQTGVGDKEGGSPASASWFSCLHIFSSVLGRKLIPFTSPGERGHFLILCWPVITAFWLWI